MTKKSTVSQEVEAEEAKVEAAAADEEPLPNIHRAKVKTLDTSSIIQPTDIDNDQEANQVIMHYTYHATLRIHHTACSETEISSAKLTQHYQKGR